MFKNKIFQWLGLQTAIDEILKWFRFGGDKLFMTDTSDIREYVSDDEKRQRYNGQPFTYKRVKVSDYKLGPRESMSFRDVELPDGTHVAVLPGWEVEITYLDEEKSESNNEE